MAKSAFFAFPASPNDLVRPIEMAIEAFQRNAERLTIVAWPQMNVFGQSIPDHVHRHIDEADIVVCDVTNENMNVYYEAGLAIGKGKALAPVVNISFSGAVQKIEKDGIFDNIGYEKYENSLQLQEILRNPPTNSLVELFSKPINLQQPIFLLDTVRKTDFRNAIASSIKESKIHYRSFDPVETPRFSTVQIISDATSSAGIIIPLLGAHIDDANRHNLRAAFLAGLSHGLGRPTLLLQQTTTDKPSPADFRELVINVKSEDEITEIVIEFTKSAYLGTQLIEQAGLKARKSDLQKISLGASAAENEFRSLDSYFVETSEFLRTLRGEVNVVAGRKGSGKTAIFFQVRDNFRQQKHTYITDLKPESHQLSPFREELLKLVDIGVYDHTLAAFWYFLTLTEILLTIKENLEVQSKSDSDILEAIDEIEHLIAQFEIKTSGDFTTRINRLGTEIIREIQDAKRSGKSLSPERITNIVYRGGVSHIKSLIIKNTQPNTQIVLLFDNIDKGWPANGINNFDIRLIRLLIEALDKVRRDFAAQKRDFMSVVFLRDDIYALLVNDTPDRGKAGQVRIDWTDRAKLRQVIFRRLQASMGDKKLGFDQLWGRVFCTKINGEDAFEYCVDHCLMRPRFLINIIENAVSNGINRGHTKVSEEDFIEAVRQHSNYLVDDFGYEIRDVSGLPEDILFALIGVDKYLSKEEVVRRFKAFGVKEADLDSAFTLMLWYGVLGIVAQDKAERFIYDYDYSMKRIEAEIKIREGEVTFVANPALHVALAV